jgi:hypothetical protein
LMRATGFQKREIRETARVFSVCAVDEEGGLNR